MVTQIVCMVCFFLTFSIHDIYCSLYCCTGYRTRSTCALHGGSFSMVLLFLNYLNEVCFNMTELKFTKWHPQNYLAGAYSILVGKSLSIKHLMMLHSVRSWYMMTGDSLWTNHLFFCSPSSKYYDYSNGFHSQCYNDFTAISTQAENLLQAAAKHMLHSNSSQKLSTGHSDVFSAKYILCLATKLQHKGNIACLWAGMTYKAELSTKEAAEVLTND